MSGYSHQSTCLNCEGQMNTSGDGKPVDLVFHECPHCGLMIYPQLEYLDLEELNVFRESYDLEPLTKLPEQSKDI